MRILVVEDFELLRESLCQGLREKGFAVDAAADGEAGLWHARSGSFDVIILDLMLPKVDGLSILQHIREQNIDSHVLILTAKDTAPDRITGLNAGADDYLVKPFDFEELVARVRALVRRKYDAKNPLIIIGDLEIDTARRTARRAGESVELTPREYALLEFLALRQGQIVSRTDIWDHVYDFNADASSNVVDVFIAHLRKKIERPGLPRIIHTRRGYGYVLGGPEPEE